jgi:carbonic anhydrase/acetyltransferase-like protein (isoleucine patch superfamily)
MKTLYLWVEEKGWTPFQYNDLSELTKEFVSRNIKLGDRCELGNWCKLGDGCELGDWCELGNWCKLGNGCELGNWCKLGDGCELGNWCKLGDNEIVPKTLFINASRHTVSYWGAEVIQIGCKRFSISEWQQHFQKIGQAENYTSDQIEEYKGYIDLIAAMHKTWSIDKQKASKE